MNFLRITNKGLIVAEDLMLIGSSTKREQTGKIGMFGSGWKYALAWLTRNDCTPVIYSGNKEIKIDFEVVLHRDKPVKVITVDGLRTSLTSEMGPQWTGWMAVREILSNAIDEGDHNIDVIKYTPVPTDTESTTIYIPMNGELQGVMDNFDNFFSFNRTPDYYNKYGAIYLKEQQGPINVFRKGIKCYNGESRSQGMFDITFDNIYINEDRLTSHDQIAEQLTQFIREGEIPADILKAILINSDDHGYIESYYTPTDGIIKALTELIQQGVEFTTSTIKRMGGLCLSGPDAITIPVSWYKKLLDMGLVVSLVELINGSNELFLPTTIRDLTEIRKCLAVLNLEDLEIRTGECESWVFVNKGIVYLNDKYQRDPETIAGLIVSKLGSDVITQRIKKARAVV
jgi:hypothetical protein